MLDLIFVVENSHDWHTQNLKMNKNHYSGLSRLIGASFIKSLNQRLAPIHYNPFVKLEQV